MNWDEFFDNSGKQYIAHLNGVKASLEKLNKDKALVLGNYTEANAPENIKDKIERDKKSWQKEWGIYGGRIQALVQKDQKEIYTAFRKQEIVNDLTAANDQSQEKNKQNGKGR